MKTQWVEYKDDLISFRMKCDANGHVFVDDLRIDFTLAGWDKCGHSGNFPFEWHKEWLFKIPELRKSEVFTPPPEKVAESPEFRGIQLRALMALEGMKKALELLRGPM